MFINAKLFLVSRKGVFKVFIVADFVSVTPQSIVGIIKGLYKEILLFLDVQNHGSPPSFRLTQGGLKGKGALVWENGIEIGSPKICG